MNNEGFSLIEWAALLALGMTGLAIFLALFRLVRGPSLLDRVLAMDLIALLVVGFIAVYAIVAGRPMLLEVAIAETLVAFLGTVAFARYLGLRGQDE